MQKKNIVPSQFQLLLHFNTNLKVKIVTTTEALRTFTKILFQSRIVKRFCMYAKDEQSPFKSTVGSKRCLGLD